LLPKKPFYAYKFVCIQNGQLVSPTYHYVWKAGLNLAGGIGNDAGLYLFLVPPGKSFAVQDRAILRIQVRPEDVLISGPDRSHGVQGTCIVCKQGTISEEDYQNALSGKTTELTSAEVEQVQETRKTVKKKVAAVKVATTRTAKKVAKKTAKKTAKAAKKTAKTDKTVRGVKKKAVKTAKKVAKKAAKKVAAKVAKASGKTPNKASGHADLSVAELRVLAKGMKIAGYSKMTKPELIKRVKKGK
jgi:hypothetical protein